MTPFKGCRATHHGQIPGPPMGQAPIDRSAHRCSPTQPGGIPTVQTGRRASKKGPAWPRTQADPRVLAPAPSTPDTQLPQDSILSSGPPGPGPMPGTEQDARKMGVGSTAWPSCEWGG